jgi:hypothetical protein
MRRRTVSARSGRSWKGRTSMRRIAVHERFFSCVIQTWPQHGMGNVMKFGNDRAEIHNNNLLPHCAR